MSSNNLLRIDGLRDAKPVLSTDSETILFSRSKFSYSEFGFGAGRGHSHPISLAHITLLNNVVGDVAATIFLWRVPQQCAGINIPLSDLYRAFRGSRDVCIDGRSLTRETKYS